MEIKKQRKKRLLGILRRWRDEEARREGVEPYRVFPNATLEALVERLPMTMAELLEVKGIKEVKQQRYGHMLLAMLHQGSEGEEKPDISMSDPVSSVSVQKAEAETEPIPILSVGQFLDGVNLELSGLAARVRGEVSTVEVRDRVVYFTLKDGEAEGVLNCLIFRSRYDILGTLLVIGDEVIVEGVPEIYKPNGRFNLRVGMIELAGEGALKKAYDALKKKLEDEGLLALEKKRPLPALVERVALITSSDGAAIGDFATNLGSNGIRVDFYPTAVEGKKAVFEILEALHHFFQFPKVYDCLVIIRGGGSLESLQAFNNETLVRAIAQSPIPVLAGIGHEKDITLAALVADIMVSTPTAAARLIGTPWEEARVFTAHARTLLIQSGAQMIIEKKRRLSDLASLLDGQFERLLARIKDLEQLLRERWQLIPLLIRNTRERLERSEQELQGAFHQRIRECHRRLEEIEVRFRHFDPERLLMLGYSLVRSGKKLIRSTQEIRVGDRLSIQFRDGGVESEVTNIV